MALRLVLGLALVAAPLSCDVGPRATSSSAPAPSPHLVWHYPDNEATGVSLNPTILLQFDRFLFPLSAVRQSICLHTGTVSSEARPRPEECIATWPQYDPVDRVIVFKLQEQLLPLTRYNLHVFPPVNEGDPTGIRAFDMVPLADEIFFAFTTGPWGVKPDATPPRDVPFCHLPTQLCPLPGNACSAPTPTVAEQALGPNAFFHGTCASGTTCHGISSTSAGGNLRLDDATGGTPGAILRLIGAESKGDPVVASQTGREPTPLVPHRSFSDGFGTNMPFIDPNNPGNSYLLYKLILAVPSRCPFDANEESAFPDPSGCGDDGTPLSPDVFEQSLYQCSDLPAPVEPDPDTHACSVDGGVMPSAHERVRAGDKVASIAEGWVPADRWKPPAKGEYDRLRRIVRGDGMPPMTPTRRQDALDVSAWIAQGAHVDRCSTE